MVLLVALGAAVILGFVGFAQTLPALVSTGAPTRTIVVAQPPAQVYAGPRNNEGYDASFPQCGETLPDTPGGFAIVGIHGGRPFEAQECVEEQLWWARQQNGFAVYANVEYDGVADPVAHGRAMADDAVDRIDALFLPTSVPVWLDVESDNMWRGTVEQHREVIQAMAVRVAERGHPVGVYSAPKLWREITGGVDPGMPVWLGIGEDDRAGAERACARSGFGGRKASLVQWIDQLPDGRVMDHDLLCPGTSATGLLVSTSAK